MSCGGGTETLKVDWSIQEDPERLAEFEAHVAVDGLVEPDDWLPHNYRVGMLKMAEHHANSEIVGALPEGEWITRAPSLRRKLALIAKVQDEVGHGQMLYRVSQDLGKSRDAMLRDLCTGVTKYHNVFNYPAPTWADVVMIQWLVDGAAIMNQRSLAEGSYGPYVRTMLRINMEEAFHFKSGEDMVLTMMSGTPQQKRMTQAAFDRWWNPCLMFFGPPDKDSVKTAPFMRWRIKTATNDTLRQKFVDRFAPAAIDLGLKIKTYKREMSGAGVPAGQTLATRTREGEAPVGEGEAPAEPFVRIREGEARAEPLGRVIRNADGSPIWVPDEKLRYNAETEHWDFSPPDWDEFYAVIRGNGPCNRERVALRRFSYEQGAWVRKAVLGDAAGLPPARN